MISRIGYAPGGRRCDLKPAGTSGRRRMDARLAVDVELTGQKVLLISLFGVGGLIGSLDIGDGIGSQISIPVPGIDVQTTLKDVDVTANGVFLHADLTLS